MLQDEQLVVAAEYVLGKPRFGLSVEACLLLGELHAARPFA